MKKKFFYMIVVSLLIPISIAPESFTKKKVKAPSLNELKENCGHGLADVMVNIAKLQEHLAQLQQEFLAKSRDLLEGQNGFFTQAKKEDLEGYSTKLTAIEQLLKSCDQSVQLLCRESKKL